MPKRTGGMAYTRVDYIHSRPQIKIRRFTMGSTDVAYNYSISLVAPYPIKISSGAIESARISANKLLEIGSGGPFLLKIVTYPHEIIREHKFMGFAGADRLSQGMGRSFGKPTKRAARVNANQAILTVYANKEGLETAKAALKRASKKLPIPCKINVQKG